MIDKSVDISKYNSAKRPSVLLPQSRIYSSGFDIKQKTIEDREGVEEDRKESCM